MRFSEECSLAWARDPVRIIELDSARRSTTSARTVSAGSSSRLAGVIHTQFLTAEPADEIQLAIAPLFVGDATAPKSVRPGVFPGDVAHRMTPVELALSMTWSCSAVVSHDVQGSQTMSNGPVPAEDLRSGTVRRLARGMRAS